MSDFLSKNGGILAVLAVVVAVGAGYLEWRIDSAVQAKFSAEAQVSPSEFAALSDKLTALENTHRREVDSVASQHQTDADRMDSKIERIVDILLEE
jgi:hypothetical protein